MFFYRCFGVIAPRQSVNHRTPPFRIEDTSTGSSNHASDKESELSEQPRTVSTPFTIARGENNPTAKLVVELLTWRLVSTTPGSVEIDSFRPMLYAAMQNQYPQILSSRGLFNHSSQKRKGNIIKREILKRNKSHCHHKKATTIYRARGIATQELTI